jgi:homeobox-leucine zipper protein
MGTVITPMATAPLAMTSFDKSMLVQLAMSAMDELVKMAQMNEPLWVPSISPPGSPTMEMLNWKEYSKTFSPCVGPKPTGFVSEASRESAIVAIDSTALVEFFMDEVLLVTTIPLRLATACIFEFTWFLELLPQIRWSDVFSCIVAKASTIEEISAGATGSRNGALRLVSVELWLGLFVTSCSCG